RARDSPDGWPVDVTRDVWKWDGPPDEQLIAERVDRATDALPHVARNLARIALDHDRCRVCRLIKAGGFDGIHALSIRPLRHMFNQERAPLVDDRSGAHVCSTRIGYGAQHGFLTSSNDSPRPSP